MLAVGSCRTLAGVRHACHLVQTSFSVDPSVRWSLPTVEISVALAILTLGVVVTVAPSAVPGLT